MKTQLDILRKKVDACDVKIIAALSERMKHVKKIGAYKKKNGLNSVDPKRRDAMIADRVQRGIKKGLDKKMMTTLYTLIHDGAVDLQK